MVVGLCLLLICLQNRSVTEVETDVGRYRLTVLKRMDSSFELTESGEFGVRVKGNSFESFKTENHPQTLRGRAHSLKGCSWAIIDDELVIGKRGALLFYNLPYFKNKRTVTLGSESEQVTRVSGGWMCNGSVYDDGGQQIQCLLSPRFDGALAETDAELMPKLL